MSRLREAYQSSPVRPVLEILERQRLIVVLGDPGSGKTSLVKYRVHEWVKQDATTADGPPLPLWVELKEYAQASLQGGIELQKYLGSGRSGYELDANRVDEYLRGGRAAI